MTLIYNITRYVFCFSTYVYRRGELTKTCLKEMSKCFNCKKGYICVLTIYIHTQLIKFVYHYHKKWEKESLSAYGIWKPKCCQPVDVHRRPSLAVSMCHRAGPCAPCAGSGRSAGRAAPTPRTPAPTSPYPAPPAMLGSWSHLHTIYRTTCYYYTS